MKGKSETGRGAGGVLAVALLMLGLALPAPAQPLGRYAAERPVMGTAFRMVAYAPDSLAAHRAFDAAFARLDALDRRLSDYRADSELSRLSATAGTGRAVPVSDDLWAVLAAAQRMAEASGGAFDVTVGPLTRLWRHARRRGTRPPEEALHAALAAVGYRHLQLGPAVQTVRLARPGMRLDLGGIAKGYAAAEALRVLEQHGLPRALVDAGGDLALGLPPPGEAGWRVAVRTVDEAGGRAAEEVLLAACAVATSGDAYRYVEVDGVRYSHLLDPRTGLGLTHRREVTVIAPGGMLADALASALSVLPPEEGLALARMHPGTAARLVEQDAGGRWHAVATPAFPSPTHPPDPDL